MTTTGILMFDDMEELDFVGPWEVMTMAKMLRDTDRVVSIGLTREEVRCNKGLRMRPDCALADAPPLDVLIVPGGSGTRPLVKDTALTTWLRERSAQCTWTASVCTGSLVLAAAGLLDGRKVTTHWAHLDELRAFSGVEVVERMRYVRDGAIVTAAGVSAGIDMTLWLLGQVATPDQARLVQHCMQYDPAPPYQALA